MKRTALLLGAALFATAPASMVEHASMAIAAAAVSSQDFVKTAGIAGMFEIESSKIAQTKSKNSDVKSFADRMITDHTKAAEELKAAAQAGGNKYEVPTALDPDHQKMIDELNTADESKFDAAYVRMQLRGHKDAVALFDSYSQQGDDPNLKSFAAKTLPTLKEHLDMVSRIAANQNVAQNTGAQPASQGLTVSELSPDNVVVASKMIGSTVYSSANENVGDINDIIMDKGGTIRAVVIGVGGFLGLGEKNVLVPLDRIQMSRDENNSLRFTINATRKELEQAPTFDRKKWSGQ